MLLAIVCIACGAFPILGGLGVVPIHLDSGVPRWMPVAAGSTFVLAAGALIVDALAGGIGPTGDLPPETSTGLRAAQNVCGFGIVVLFAVIMSWIAFGKGERHFTTTLALPFMWTRRASGDTMGRWMFGAFALLLWVVVFAVCAKVLRRLARRVQRP